MFNKAMLLAQKSGGGETTLTLGIDAFGGGGALSDAETNEIIDDFSSGSYEELTVTVEIGKQYYFRVNTAVPVVYTISESRNVTVDHASLNQWLDTYCYFTVTGANPRIILYGEYDESGLV